jgi:hypothetical protein
METAARQRAAPPLARSVSSWRSFTLYEIGTDFGVKHNRSSHAW